MLSLKVSSTEVQVVALCKEELAFSTELSRVPGTPRVPERGSRGMKKMHKGSDILVKSMVLVADCISAAAWNRTAMGFVPVGALTRISAGC